MAETGFIILTVLFLLLFYFGTGRNKAVLFTSLLWLLIAGTFAFTGYFENTSVIPPRFLLVLAGILLISFIFYKILKDTAIYPVCNLLIHSLRIVVEIYLYQLYLQKLVPVSMTFTGWNFDIFIGISALILLSYKFLSRREINKSLWIVWNITGIVLLSIIVVTAVISSPLPIQVLAFDQPNKAVLQFPYIFLPAYIVPVVFISHFLSLRQCRNIER